MCVWYENSRMRFSLYHCTIKKKKKKVHYLFLPSLDFWPSMLLYNKKNCSDSDNRINTSINCNMQFEGSGGDWIMLCKIIIPCQWSLCCCEGTEELWKCVLPAKRSLCLSLNGILALQLARRLKSSEIGAFHS